MTVTFAVLRTVGLGLACGTAGAAERSVPGTYGFRIDPMKWVAVLFLTMSSAKLPPRRTTAWPATAPALGLSTSAKMKDFRLMSTGPRRV